MASLPDDIPGYRILRVLGQGGMATVYLAEQESLGRQVALKLLADRYAEDAEASGRFVREARTAARLVHRHIVGIHDVGSHQGRPYLAMEYLPGDSLPVQRSPPLEALQAVREIALALDHAHREGVVHRDVKPENILRRADGSHALADFGIARTADTATVMTREGITLGTPHYMSPEQLQGKPLDGRSDLYSLGVVLYQLLTGSLPYQGTDGWSVGVQHITAPIPRLPPELARLQPLVDRLMAKDPAERPQSGAEAARLIEAAQAGLTPAPTQVLPRHAQSLAPRRRVVAIAAVAVLAFLAWAGWRMLAERQAPADSAFATTAPATQVDRSIAVLPLTNIGGDASNDYFSDGLAETVLDMLARSPDLRVIARTSSFAFKGRNMDVREIGKALGAAHLLQGSVQQGKDTVRIRAQLVRAADGAVLWSGRYDRQLADVFKIQDEVATEVVTALQGALPQADRQRLLAARTTDVAAYREYLKGNALLRLRRVDELREALMHYRQAIAIDPRFARAHVGAATALTLLEAHGGLNAAQRQEMAEFTERALELDPRLGEAHIAQAAVLQGKDTEGAELAFKRGIKLAPNYATGWQWYGEFLSRDRGRPEDAIPVLKRALELDPLAPIIHTEMARALQRTGRVDEAERISDMLIQKYPRFPQGYGLRADLRWARNDLAGTLDAINRRIQSDPASARARSDRCTTLMQAGAISQARACAETLRGLDGLDSWRAEFEFLQTFIDGDVARGIRLTLAQPDAEGWQKAWMLRMQGKHAEALEIYRQEWPEWLSQPVAVSAVASPFDGLDTALALMGLGRTQQAQDVLRHLLAITAKWPRSGDLGRGWSDVYAQAYLGEPQVACKLIESAAAEGYYSGYQSLTADPDLAILRKHPCFAPAFAKVEAVARRGREAAAKAGVL